MNRNQRRAKDARRTKEALNPNESYRAGFINLRGLNNNALNNLTYNIARVSAITGIIPEATLEEPKQLYWRHPELLIIIGWHRGELSLSAHPNAGSPFSERAQNIVKLVTEDDFSQVFPGDSISAPTGTVH